MSQQECGPADDLIGWLYSVVSRLFYYTSFIPSQPFQIELYQGHLPWAKTPDPTEVIRMKAEMPLTEVCESMPPSFLQCFEHANHLSTEETPDYSKVQKCLRECLPEECDFKDPYDWE